MPDSPLAVARSVCRARGLLTQRQAQHIWSQQIFCCLVVGRLAASDRWRHSWQHAIESQARLHWKAYKKSVSSLRMNRLLDAPQQNESYSITSSAGGQDFGSPTCGASRT